MMTLRIVLVILIISSGSIIFPAFSQSPQQCDGRDATIVGTEGNDTLEGTPGDDVIVGLGGDDTITGGDGDDVICGGDGDDSIWGGNGNDIIFGGNGSDRLNGDEGDDQIIGGAGQDNIDGGRDNDTCDKEEDSKEPRDCENTTSGPDTKPPVIAIPDNITVQSIDEPMSVEFTVTVTDNIDSNITPICTPISGYVFPIGTTQVTCTATDSAGNESSESFTVTVIEDTTPTVITVPNNITVKTTDLSKSVEFTVTATDAVDGSIIPSCSPISGYVFPRGTTQVTCTAMDSAGNESSESFTVTIIEEDTTPPVIIVQSDMVVNTTINNPLPVTFSVSVSDDLDGNIVPTCVPSSGSDFPIGKTKVTCTATDTSGNTSSESFSITVTFKEKTPEPKELGLASFVDEDEDPQSYVDRYNDDKKYKKWFDKNYPEYSSIYEAVGLEMPLEILELESALCGAGTVLIDGVCYAESRSPCGTGTVLIDGVCYVESEVEIIDDTKSEPTCGAGTGLNSIGQCIRLTPSTSSQTSPSSQTSDGGCLIATATYGTELAPQVQQLRELRDNTLLQTNSGTLFMESFNDFYYSFSPYIADYERENPVLLVSQF